MNCVSNAMRLAILMVGCLGLSASAFALSKAQGDLPLDKLVGLSDEIVIGTVKAKEAKVVGRHIETDYEVEVAESLKGKSSAPGQTLKVTVVGGSLTTPPLTQYVMGTASMFRGEKVALFLNRKPVPLPEETKKRLDSKSNLHNTPRIVGMTQGKFSIITDPTTGKEKITRFNLENYGFAPNDVALEKSLRAIESRVLTSVEAQVVQESGEAVPCTHDGCLAPHHGHQNAAARKAALNATGEEALNKAAQGGAIPVQDLEQFKDQVRKFAR